MASNSPAAVPCWALPLGRRPVSITAPLSSAIHLGQHVAQVEENALQVHADHGIKRQLVAIRGRRNLTFGTRVVEEAIDLAVFFNSRLT